MVNESAERMFSEVRVSNSRMEEWKYEQKAKKHMTVKETQAAEEV